MAVRKIADIRDREEVNVVAKVVKVNPTRTFNKRTGGQGRVRNIEIEDDSGSCR
jgi:replication factor A1